MRLEPAEFTGRLLDDLTSATQKESPGTNSAVYPPYVQMAVERLSDLAENGLVRVEQYLALAPGEESPLEQIILDYLQRNVEKLADKGYQIEEAQRVLIAMAHTSGRKARTDKLRIAAESEISEETLSRLLLDMASLRLVRRLASDEWEIVHDLLAKNITAELLNEEERRFKEAREFLDARARGFERYHDSLQAYEMKDLWLSRQRLPTARIGSQERLVLLQSMAALDACEISDAGHMYGDHIEDAAR